MAKRRTRYENADRIRIMRDCIEEGFYKGSLGDDQTRASAELGYKPLSREIQLANVELAFASMVAGCVITLMVVAMVMEFCNFPNLSKKVTNKMKRFSVKNKPKPVTVSTVQGIEGENVSVLYEDIDEDEDTLNTEIRPESPLPSVDNRQGPGATTRHGNTKFPLGSQSLTSSHHLQIPEASSRPAAFSTQTSNHMVPKTKATPLKKEKGGKVARPSRPPQLEHKESAGYIHPVYN